MNTTRNTRRLVEGAMLIALATILSYIKFYHMPFGGSITLEMLPLVVMGLRNGPKWGCFTGFVHGLLQMIVGFSNVMYCATLLSQLGCILLDYLFAYTVLGLTPVFAGLCKKHKQVGYVIGAAVCGSLRFACSFLSGWLLWSAWAPEGMSPVIYSLTYNGSYMIPDIIILSAVIGILSAVAPKLFQTDAG